MRTLLAIRIPLAWFLLALIALGAGGIVWLIATKGSTPTNAVLINSAPTDESGGQAFADVQPGGVAPQGTANVYPTPQTLVVYVSGEVLSPGVYTLPAGSRVAAAVAAAGGFTAQANREGINLAARVGDEQHISVPRTGEPLEATGDATIGDATRAGGKSNGSGVPTPVQPTVGHTSPLKVNINTATAQELEELPGIGEVLAQRIVADREANGPFKTVDDLARVPGIKEGVMSQLRDLVTVGP